MYELGHASFLICSFKLFFFLKIGSISFLGVFSMIFVFLYPYVSPLMFPLLAQHTQLMAKYFKLEQSMDEDI